MVWTSWEQFFAMGGHGVYVWWSFAACIAALLIENLFLRHARQQVLSHIRRKHQLAQMQISEQDRGQA